MWIGLVNWEKSPISAQVKVRKSLIVIIIRFKIKLVGKNTTKICTSTKTTPRSPKCTVTADQSTINKVNPSS